MSANIATNQPTIQGAMMPEIYDALRTTRYAAGVIEDEYAPFGWDERCELAAEVREMIAETPASSGILDLARAVEFRLESEAYSFEDWQERAEVIVLLRSIINRLISGKGGAR